MMAKRTVLLGMLICATSVAAFGQPAAIAPNIGWRHRTLHDVHGGQPPRRAVHAGHLRLVPAADRRAVLPESAGRDRATSPSTAATCLARPRPDQLVVGLRRRRRPGHPERRRLGSAATSTASGSSARSTRPKARRSGSARSSTSTPRSIPTSASPAGWPGTFPISDARPRRRHRQHDRRRQLAARRLGVGRRDFEVLFTGMVSYTLSGSQNGPTQTSDEIRVANIVKFGVGATIPVGTPMIQVIIETLYNVYDGGDFPQHDYAELNGGARLWFGHSGWAVSGALSTNLTMLFNHGTDPEPVRRHPRRHLRGLAAGSPAAGRRPGARAGRRSDRLPRRPPCSGAAAAPAPGAPLDHRRDPLRRHQRPADQHREGRPGRRGPAHEERPERHGRRHRLHRQHRAPSSPTWSSAPAGPRPPRTIWSPATGSTPAASRPPPAAPRTRRSTTPPPKGRRRTAGPRSW